MDQNRAIAIQLTEGGGFQIEDAKGLIVELGFDPQSGAEPWCISVIDATGRCRHSETVPTLDIGLDRLSILGSATLNGLRGLYRVELPGGASFQRPGSVPAEEILRKLEFNFVGSVHAFLVARLDGAMSQVEAALWFRDKVGVLAPLLGSVDLVESDEIEASWCADVLLPVNGFYRPQDLLGFARSAVGACGVEMSAEISVYEEDISVLPLGEVVRFAERAAG
jgi:hypothetical protein